MCQLLTIVQLVTIFSTHAYGNFKVKVSGERDITLIHEFTITEQHNNTSTRIEIETIGYKNDRRLSGQELMANNEVNKMKSNLDEITVNVIRENILQRNSIDESENKSTLVEVVVASAILVGVVTGMLSFLL